MERITEKKLKSVIKNHQHWLKKDCEGWENMRAVLRYKDLRYMDLSNADLRYADLYNSDLSYTHLYFANFEHASLCNAWLAHANLNYVNFSYADLQHSDLMCADFNNANLSYVDFSYANLGCANLDMSNLYKAKMVHTNLHITRFKNTTNIPYIPTVCPEEGEFIGWKQALTNNNIKVIIKLRISADAKRLSGSSRKCRCNKAEVIGIYNIDGTILKRKCISMYDRRFVYKLGETVEVNNFDEDRWDECSNGIHFFMNKQEAIDY